MTDRPVGSVLRLRQVALVAADLEPIATEIETRLGIAECYRDPGVAEFGLRNVLYPIGDQFLEVVSPVAAGTTAGRFLDRRGGDAGYMVLFEVDGLADHRARLDRLGVRIVYEAAAPGITGLHLHPRDVGGAIVSLDDAGGSGEWPWAGPRWRDHVVAGAPSRIAAVGVAALDPGAMAGRWADVLGCEVRTDHPIVAVGDTEVRFVRTSTVDGEGIVALELVVGDAARAGVTHLIGGCRFDLTAG